MISSLLIYKYFLLFPLAVIEGPIITIIAGLFVKTGIFNLYMVYAVVVLGDMFGDSIAYATGRFGGPLLLNRFSKFFHITEEKVEKAKSYFDLHHHRTLIFSKIIHGIGVAGLVTAGNLKIQYRKFFFICFCVSLLQSAVFLFAGVLFGSAYAKIGQYLDFFSTGTIIVGIIIAFILFLYFRFRKI